MAVPRLLTDENTHDAAPRHIQRPTLQAHPALWCAASHKCGVWYVGRCISSASIPFRLPLQNSNKTPAWAPHIWHASLRTAPLTTGASLRSAPLTTGTRTLPIVCRPRPSYIHLPLLDGSCLFMTTGILFPAPLQSPSDLKHPSRCHNNLFVAPRIACPAAHTCFEPCRLATAALCHPQFRLMVARSPRYAAGSIVPFHHSCNHRRLPFSPFKSLLSLPSRT